MVFITHIRMSSGGTGHEHITHVKWRNDADNSANQCSTDRMVTFIDVEKGVVYVTDGKSTVRVGVVDHKYLRTHADGKWSNNLLSLPRF